MFTQTLNSLPWKGIDTAYSLKLSILCHEKDLKLLAESFDPLPWKEIETIHWNPRCTAVKTNKTFTEKELIKTTHWNTLSIAVKRNIDTLSIAVKTNIDSSLKFSTLEGRVGRVTFEILTFSPVSRREFRFQLKPGFELAINYTQQNKSPSS